MGGCYTEGAASAKKPDAAAREAIAYFKSQGDESRAAGLQRYFKEPVNYYGIEYRPYKEWKAEFLARLAGHWTLRDAAYEVATELLDDKEDLIHKAVGWLLPEAGKVDRARLEAYLLGKGPRLPRTTLRYAIEKFPKEDRKRLLEATR